MQEMLQLTPIAHIKNDFSSKFGVPRQSGLTCGLKSVIVFEEEFRVPEAFRGLEQFSHLWLIWMFSESVRETWHPTVRPPRLGGNKRIGVFATRSPFRPNPIGLSSVKIESIDISAKDGGIITVSDADLMNGTPIFDIKPYLSYTDSIPDAVNGFAEKVLHYKLKVFIPSEIEQKVPKEKLDSLYALLAGDPRPSYQNDENRVYGFDFAGREIKFTVKNGVLTVTDILE